MFYVTSLDGSQVEPLINIDSDFRMEQSTDGTFIVSFSCFPSKENAGYEILQSESVVTINDFDFRVKQYNDTEFKKSVVAVNIFFDHSKTRQNIMFTGNHTLLNHINFALNGIGWTFTVDPAIGNLTNYITGFGNDNVISLINKICRYYNCEYMILPNKQLHFAKQIGGNYDYQYRYRHNVSSVVLIEDTTELETFIHGIGKDGMEVSYASPNYSIFGHREADLIKDERFINQQALIEYIASKLRDEPKIAIESSIPELTEREIGERVWLIYEPLNIELETRILKQSKTLVNGKLVTANVVFGNSLPKSSIDVLVEQQEQINDTNNYIEETKEEINETIEETVREISYRFEETEEIIQDQYTTITNEYSASITANAQVIRTEMNQKETTINNTIGAQYTKITAEYNSAITQTAQSIRSDVTASITAVNGSIQNVQNYASRIEQTAQQIQSTVSSQQTTINGLGTRVSSAESSIIQQSNLISQKVSQTDFTGRTITSLINQDPYAISISASRINLNGAIMVNGKIEGATTISVTTDINLGRILRFNDNTAISSGDGNITLGAWNSIYYQGSRHNFYGTVDFSSANVTGLSTGGITMAYSTSGSKKYITFRQNGVYLGQVEIL